MVVLFNEMKRTKGGTGFSGVEKEFRFYHVTFEVLIRYPNGSVKAIGYTNVKCKKTGPGWRYKIGINL